MILRLKDKDNITKIAKRTLETSCEIWAYGSRVYGDAYPTSDLDLVILSRNCKPLPTQEIISFRQALSDSNIPITVEVLDWYCIPKFFQQNILKKYEFFMEI